MSIAFPDEDNYKVISNRGKKGRKGVEAGQPRWL